MGQFEDRVTPDRGSRDAVNPYAPPVEPEPGSGRLTTAQVKALRAAGTDRAATIKTVGVFYYLAAGVPALASAGAFIDIAQGHVVRGALVVASTSLAFALSFAMTGRWLVRLRSRGRIAATTVALLGMFGLARDVFTRSTEAWSQGAVAGVVFGALVLAGVLWILWSPPSGTVFSAPYREAARR